MDVGDCVGDSFDFEVTALHVDRSLRPSYSNNIINNTTGGNAISRILAVCGCQPATPPASYRWRLLPNSFEPRLPVHETTLCQWPTTTVRHIATYNVTRHNLHVIITYYTKYRVVNIDSRKHF